MYPLSRHPQLSSHVIYRPIPDWQRRAQLGLLDPNELLYDPATGVWRRAENHPHLHPYFQAPYKPTDWTSLLGIGLVISLLLGAYKAATNARLRDLTWVDLRQAIFRRDNYTCVYCGHRGNTQTLQIDHVVPVTRGGSDDPSNLATACWLCNLQKGTRTGWEYRLWRLFHAS